jgi:hypothetical protein
VELIFDYTCSLKHLITAPNDYHDITIEIKPKSSLFDEIELQDLHEIFSQHDKTKACHKE